MKCLSFKPGHDGTIAYIDSGHLEFSLEAEKDSFPRYDVVGPATFLNALRSLDGIPDLVCVSGWPKGFHSAEPLQQGRGYFGVEAGSTFTDEIFLMGKRARYFESTHERSHIWCAYGMSPFPSGQPVYVLVYEGNIGRFYRIDENNQIHAYPAVMRDPGNKYAFLYNLADPRVPDGRGVFRFDHAGKVMALAAYSKSGDWHEEEREVLSWILGHPAIVLEGDKAELRHTRYYNCGVESEVFKQLARKLSDEIFRCFSEFAERHLEQRLPLLIAGGCGLNCDWNRAWIDSGIFPSVFVPPVTNDSGSAIGTAVDALREFGLPPKITWSAYSGLEPRIEVEDQSLSLPYDPSHVARLLFSGNVVAVMWGRYEIGPRALGNRSILASPFDRSMLKRLNQIKGRENFRPIAPIVKEEAAATYFDLPFKSPHMLYFARVLDQRLEAVTHVDGSARPQTVSIDENRNAYELLSAFESVSGVPVLCNTSLNFNGRGFINSDHDLITYCRAHGVDVAVANDRTYLLSGNALA